MRTRIPIALLSAGLPVLLALALCGPSSAAVAPAPAFSIDAIAGPTIFSAAHNGGLIPDTYTVYVTNTGSVPTDGSPIKIGYELPRGLVATGLSGVARHTKSDSSELICEVAAASCTYNGVLQPDEQMTVLIDVTVAPGTVGPLTSNVSASGGGTPSASTNVRTAIGTAEESTTEPFGLANFTDEATGVNGLVDEQAGDHPYETTVTFSLNTFDGRTFTQSDGVAGGFHGLGGHVKDVVADLPPGFAGDPTVVERCPQFKAAAEECPPGTQVGTARLDLISRKVQKVALLASFPYPIYNVVPEKGYPAQFDIVLTDFHVSVPLYVNVNPDTGYDIRVITPGIPMLATPVDVSVTFYGTPATDMSPYNGYRTSVSGVTPTAFLDDPADCSTAPQVATLSVDSWESPGPWLANGQPDLSGPGWVSSSTTLFPSLAGCELLQFNPTLTVTPDTTRADEPAGTTVDLHIPQAPQEFPALVTPEFKDTTVTLPSGLSISPSAGDGLQGCSDEQIGISSASVGTCPQGSQIGTVKVVTPLVPEPLEGEIFLGTPHCDPCTDADASDGNMYRMFLEIEGVGAVIKLEGKVFTNSSTGQLTTTFKNSPELPVSDVQLRFNSGLRAALATPQTCGTYTSTADMTPWSSPITPDATPGSQFNVDWDGNGGACPATTPFNPSFSAGTSNPNAGQLSPLTVTFNREDREQDISQLKVVTPPGLLGSLSSVPLCGEPQADLGTCSAASQIGEMTVAAGPGSHPYYQKGMVYLTGPYKGAPFGLAIVVPTHAGPFNLGNIVVRARISVDPITTALTVTTDPLPQIIDGIPLRLRTTNVTINRPGFIFNPTDCGQLHITATISGAQGAQAQVSTPFAVAGCAGLSFGPKFSVATSGKTSKAGGASLDAKLAVPPGAQSNIARVKVELPKQLPSRLTTLQKACPAATFEANPAACPAASQIGAVQAVTPILPVKLRGPVYFVSHGGAAFPNLVAVLQGYGVVVDLIGETFISKAGITSSTFTNIPDVPVSSFELFLPEGKYSALAANGNLCKDTLKMPTSFVAQDGAQFKQSVPIKITGCPKAKKASKKKAKKAKSARTTGHAHSNGRKS
jgi:hypothetical protein